MEVERYRTRLWALYDGFELVAVFTYRKGALEVLNRLVATQDELGRLRDENDRLKTQFGRLLPREAPVQLSLLPADP